jgi:hypothetical protein
MSACKIGYGRCLDRRGWVLGFNGQRQVVLERCPDPVFHVTHEVDGLMDLPLVGSIYGSMSDLAPGLNISFHFTLRCNYYVHTFARRTTESSLSFFSYPPFCWPLPFPVPLTPFVDRGTLSRDLVLGSRHPATPPVSTLAGREAEQTLAAETKPNHAGGVS